MSIKRMVKNKWFWLLSCLLLAATPLIIISCSGDYDTPLTTQTPTALVAPATLKAWMDAGLVNGTGYDRVVLIDVNASATYAAGHINGAMFLDSALMSENRFEGPAVTSTEVPTGARMDDILIPALGITKNTTIVFTGDAYWRVTRAYFIFRYWGFPRNRLKVLDGLNGNAVGAATYRNTYPADWGTAAAPTPAATTFSVRDNKTLRNDLRISLSEMIDYAEGKVPNAVAIDVRSIPTAGSYAGVAASTGSTFGAADQPVFEGHIKGAKAMLFSDLYNTNLLFKDTATLTSYFTAASVGLDTTKTAYIYCKLGYLGSIAFFVLDGILGWPAAFYEGSWSQWGQLSANTAMGGMLDSNSPWRTDIASRSELIVYNDPSLRAIEVLAYDGSACSPTNAGGTWSYSPAACTYVLPDSLAASGNQLEADDMEYMETGSGGTGGGGGGGGGC